MNLARKKERDKVKLYKLERETLEMQAVPKFP
jgi:hypothetical protein